MNWRIVAAGVFAVLAFVNILLAGEAAIQATAAAVCLAQCVSCMRDAVLDRP